jgi:hypothetical protein
MLLDFINIGGPEIGLILAILAVPALLILYCLVDILRSDFKTSLMKVVFLILVLFAPFLGSIIYLVIRKDYVKTKNSPMI